MISRFKAVLIVTVLAYGCAGPVYNKAGASNATLEKDHNECRFVAVQATASAPGGSILYHGGMTMANDLAVGMRQGELYRLCLLNKGYRRVQ